MSMKLLRRTDLNSAKAALPQDAAQLLSLLVEWGDDAHLLRGERAADVIQEFAHEISHNRRLTVVVERGRVLLLGLTSALHRAEEHREALFRLALRPSCEGLDTLALGHRLQLTFVRNARQQAHQGRMRAIVVGETRRKELGADVQWQRSHPLHDRAVQAMH
eukprot:scaffold207657_cov27-Tisochrysis_lutea.AAC.3